KTLRVEASIIAVRKKPPWICPAEKKGTTLELAFDSQLTMFSSPVPRKQRRHSLLSSLWTRYAVTSVRSAGLLAVSATVSFQGTPARRCIALAKVSASEYDHDDAAPRMAARCRS